jgi:hypothetical protein
MSDTIEVSLPGDHVRKIGGNAAFQELVTLADETASGMGKQLASREYKDTSTRIDKENDRYITTFKLR